MKKLISVILSFLLIFSLVVIPAMPVKAAPTYTLSGTAHVQTFGDVKGTFDNGVLKLGTKGLSKRLENVTINFVNNTGYEGDIKYRVHVQSFGWSDWSYSGQPAGTSGKGKRLEGIQIELTGELAKHYSVKYRVHIQTYGDNQGWQYDGALAGTEGEAKRLENLEVCLVPKKSDTPTSVAYRVHRQTYGWETTYAKDGKVSGTTGQSKRLEGIEIALVGNEYSGGITYTTHVQTYGWLPEVSNGMMSGTTGQAKRLEAIQINLTGEIVNYYDVYYRVHAQTYGWLGWAKNGEMSGTTGLARRLEAIQIMLVKKNQTPPVSYDGVVSNTTYKVVTPENQGSVKKPGSSQNPGSQNPSSQNPTSQTHECVFEDVWVQDKYWHIEHDVPVYDIIKGYVCAKCGLFLDDETEMLNHALMVCKCNFYSDYPKYVLIKTKDVYYGIDNSTYDDINDVGHYEKKCKICGKLQSVWEYEGYTGNWVQTEEAKSERLDTLYKTTVYYECPNCLEVFNTEYTPHFITCKPQDRFRRKLETDYETVIFENVVYRQSRGYVNPIPPNN